MEECLPKHIKAVQDAGLKVVWSCDPCHGNTRTTQAGAGGEGGRKGADGAAGLKTRNFGSIVQELRRSFEIHAQHNSRLMGVHLELTGEDVTECTGGVQGLVDEDLGANYTTYCDPRLNYAQSMEVAFLCSEFLRDHEETIKKRSASF